MSPKLSTLVWVLSVASISLACKEDTFKSKEDSVEVDTKATTSDTQKTEEVVVIPTPVTGAYLACAPYSVSATSGQMSCQSRSEDGLPMSLDEVYSEYEWLFAGTGLEALPISTEKLATDPSITWIKATGAQDNLETFFKDIKVSVRGLKGEQIELLEPLDQEIDEQMQRIFADTCQTLYTLGYRTSGVYYLIIESLEGLIPAYCDMETDQGGWTLVLNYLHLADSNPPQSYRVQSLPHKSSDDLGIDGSLNAEQWGQATPALLNLMNYSEIRFFCITSMHERMVHFKTDAPGCIASTKTGTGSCSEMLGPDGRHQLLDGHTADSPVFSDSAYDSQGDNTLGRIWNEASNTGSVGDGAEWIIDNSANRFQCDFDWDNFVVHNTLHRIYIR
ncbi:fibrinogen-like YCDxxxxGGGW domain-containing protein [Pseudobacteriovorax antillogorgiicola]|uniref:Fibrinogen beta and gamma chains, C-terminal globular domain n=1 Tax=Pseudobacteriovorax antillogorgiicola TaxID=1513793 RepID=A0A1Y6BUC5_9BACT|nr:fibrinogen-like YCDxxxxGGGW domain-containing protein [Pseudobacteriovorax antillogorgiicola]TCS53113.1 fibrinogen beta/gamma subunit family protein [Pseudobacteriovorax antillogorgiicola]SMF25551.1 Fibrinogen beta and gamma chains, C-terminal globular domain [Pseudobacteriovorax antillogorgiicola]